jgi:hypothetical protein
LVSSVNEKSLDFTFGKVSFTLDPVLTNSYRQASPRRNDMVAVMPADRFVVMFGKPTILADKLEEQGKNLMAMWTEDNAAPETRTRRNPVNMKFPLVKHLWRNHLGTRVDGAVYELWLNTYSFTKQNQNLFDPNPITLKDIRVNCSALFPFSLLLLRPQKRKRPKNESSLFFFYCR